MYTLFISTYDKYINIALLKDNEVLEHNVKESINAHSIYTMPMIKKVLDKNNITPKDLNQIEVINGPGSFTGVRIGVTIAKTLSYTLNIPIKTITSIEALALSLPLQKKLVTIEDIKGVYYGLFNENNELLEPLNYLNNNEFNKYIEKNNYKTLIGKIDNLNIKNIHLYLENKTPTNPHHVNPIYIKQIEAEK